MGWSISIKTVGTGDKAASAGSPGKKSSTSHASTEKSASPELPLTVEKNATTGTVSGTDKCIDDSDTPGAENKKCLKSLSTFVVDVEPEAPISTLHNSIEEVTGLAASQQRLIYRGRIISQPGNGLPGNGANRTGGENIGENIAQNQNSPFNANGDVDAVPGTKVTNTAAEKKTVQRIRDVQGLGDGQTIHLVPRAAPLPSQTPTLPVASGTNDEGIDASASSASRSGSATASLLATLLGLGTNAVTPVVIRETNDVNGESVSAESNSNNNVSNSGNGTTETIVSEVEDAATIPSLLRRIDSVGGTAQPQSQRRTVVARRRRGRGVRGGPPRMRDPGSLEPVRQGLLTLHTLLAPHERRLEQMRNGFGAEPNAVGVTSPSDSTRRFYKGQWVDVRDTVNQWLEATILDVALPCEILLSTGEGPTVVHSTTIQSDETFRRNRTRRRDGDLPIVSATDLDGRRALLVEQTGPTQDDANGDSGAESALLARERPDNDNLQLLLVHYNGWPHRWDEWIRSDSERIRPFRTRTRHTPQSASGYASPNIQSVYPEAPSTALHVRGRDDINIERSAMLPELSRVIGMVSHLLDSTSVGGMEDEHYLVGGTGDGSSSMDVEEKTEDDITHGGTSEEPNRCLPWVSIHSNNATAGNAYLNGDESVTGLRQRREQSGYNRDVLSALAPLLDRMGRTLTDAAPHVAALSETLSDRVESQPEVCDLSQPGERNTIAGDAGAECSDAVGTEFSGSATIEESSNPTTLPSEEERNTPESLFDEPRERNEAGNTLSDGLNTASGLGSGVTSGESNVDNNDIVDFVNGMVNTNVSRSERSSSDSRNSSSRRARRGGYGGGGSLLGSYLAASGLAGRGTSFNSANGEDDGSDGEDNDGDGGTSSGSDTGSGGNNLPPAALARLIGGGNIDIHIHAVVTPGFGPGGVAFALPTTATNGSTSSNPGPAVAEGGSTGEQLVVNDDDMGLFDELYSGAVDGGEASASLPVEGGRDDVSSGINAEGDNELPSLDIRNDSESDDDDLPPLINRLSSNSSQEESDDGETVEPSVVTPPASVENNKRPPLLNECDDVKDDDAVATVGKLDDAGEDTREEVEGECILNETGTRRNEIEADDEENAAERTTQGLVASSTNGPLLFSEVETDDEKTKEVQDEGPACDNSWSSENEMCVSGYASAKDEPSTSTDMDEETDTNNTLSSQDSSERRKNASGRASRMMKKFKRSFGRGSN